MIKSLLFLLLSGLKWGKLATTGGTESLVAAIAQVDGKYMLFCFGNGGSSQPYNVLLVQN